MESALQVCVTFLQARDLVAWANQKETDMMADETVRDVTSVDMLRKHHEQLKAEIDTREDIFSTVVETGSTMVESGHFASQDVSPIYTS